MRFSLFNGQFGNTDRVLLEGVHFKATAKRYSSGVAALLVETRDMAMEILPFQGQQIWSVTVGGRRLTMKSMNSEPVNSQNYLEAYGAFFIHCGLTAIGSPGPEDRHPLHGELPNACYEDAYIELGGSWQNPSLSVGGAFRYTLAFATSYRFDPEVTIPAEGTLFDMEVKATNLKASPMDLMYLGHANFMPIDDAELKYSARYVPTDVVLRTSIPPHLRPNEHYLEDLAKLAANPALHHRIGSRAAFDPEAVFMVKYRADSSGWAHSLQVLPDGSSDYIAFRPCEFPAAIRWVCLTPDQRGLGLALPTTSGVEGAAKEIAAGRSVKVPPGGSWQARMRMGTLSAEETRTITTVIETLNT
ncbi:hypothetical protein ABIB57_002063 [Devosia sp. UYZn731]|uniref:DUF4432 family protein n=1 Tax=Devosia sp. UYZn731 TaxID=3156345 RepID=UPI00339321F6